MIGYPAIDDISIHAPLAGCDQTALNALGYDCDFNPRTPCGVRHDAVCGLMTDGTHFNPRTPCGVRPCGIQHRWHIGGKISIHAPLAGCDIFILISFRCTIYFNPRTPCGVRHDCGTADGIFGVFQSTHPLRGATIIPRRVISAPAFQSTHPLRGATAKTYKENCTFFELADKLSARIAAKKPSAKADRCA